MIFGNKKGNAIIDGITIIVVMVAMGMLGVFSYYTFDILNTDLMADDDLHQDAKDISNNLYGKHANLMDNLFLLAFALFALFTVVSAFVIDTHPIFFMISVILLVSVLVVAMLMANVYDDVMSDDTISAYANDFTFTGWLMGHLLEVILAVVFIIVIVLFIKFKS